VLLIVRASPAGGTTLIREFIEPDRQTAKRAAGDERPAKTDQQDVVSPQRRSMSGHPRRHTHS
jgi:hypothetical protein